MSWKIHFFLPRFFTRDCVKGAALLLILGILANQYVLAGSKELRPFGIEQRVSCQKIIEDIRWSHRIWPPGNKSQKPPRSKVLSDDQISNAVENVMRMETALSGLYGSNISKDMLQREMDRMARNTKDPARLQELFVSLGNDPTMIAECLARPVLVKRQMQRSYAWDKKVHEDLRAKAERFLNSENASEDLALTGGYEERVTLVRTTHDTPLTENKDVTDGKLHIELNPEKFDQEVARLTGEGNGESEWSSGRKAQLVETETAFVYEEILHKTDDQLDIRVLTWEKSSFGDWWDSESGNWEVSLHELPYSRLRLPIVTRNSKSVKELETATATATATASSPSWTLSEVPAGRIEHTAIWTGSEMIVWGGRTGATTNTGGRYDPISDNWTTVNRIGAPSKRDNHTAIWTGSEMIIWGGFVGGERSNTGARYNPNTDSWTSMDGTGVPSGRSGHTAIWTGSEMIVWGGVDTSQRVQTGGRYDPATGTWVSTDTIGAPTGRDEHTAIWTGSEMIIWGGNDGAETNTGGRYNPATDTWTSTDSSDIDTPSARRSHTAIWSGTEMIIWGGFSGPLNSGGRYNPSTDTWDVTNLTNAPAGRGRHTAVWTGSEMIIWGGWSSTSSPYNTGGKYNPAIDTWQSTSTTDSPLERQGHTAIWTGAQMVVWGGSQTGGGFDTGGRYDPVSDTWLATHDTGAPTGRRLHTATWTGSEMIVWGGYYRDTRERHLSTGGVYDPVVDSWMPTSMINVPDGRQYHTAIWSGTEMIVWGGEISVSGTLTNAGGRYNPMADSWESLTLADAPVERMFHTAVWTGSEMIVWGGFFDSSTLLNSGGRYNPSMDSWVGTQLTSAPSERYGHSAIWNGLVMTVWGGDSTFGGENHLNTGGHYDPVANSWQPTDTSDIDTPSARINHTGLWTGTEMIIWGGYDGEYTNNGARYNYDNNSWTGMSSLGEPGGRQLHTGVWTGSEMIVWGGWTAPLIEVNTGGRYDPVLDTWIPTSVHGAPVERSSHTAVWTGNEMIIWGGFNTLRDMGIYSTANSWTLDVAVTGQGSVTSDPEGIDCGSICVADFLRDTMLTLTPSYDSTWTLGSWTWLGDCSGDWTCELVMDAPKYAHAVFHCILISIPEQMEPITDARTWECFDLETAGIFEVIGPGGNVTLNAQNSVGLSPGLLVGPGGTFRVNVGL